VGNWGGVFVFLLWFTELIWWEQKQAASAGKHIQTLHQRMEKCWKRRTDATQVFQRKCSKERTFTGDIGGLQHYGLERRYKVSKSTTKKVVFDMWHLYEKNKESTTDSVTRSFYTKKIQRLTDDRWNQAVEQHDMISKKAARAQSVNTTSGQWVNGGHT